MKFKTPEIIKKLETKIKSGYSLPIFKGYKAINKRGVEKLIDELYANLPSDVKEAREYLKSKQYSLDSLPNNKFYDTVQNLETKLDQGITLYAELIILNIREIEELLNKLQDNLPEEIIKAETLSK